MKMMSFKITQAISRGIGQTLIPLAVSVVAIHIEGKFIFLKSKPNLY